MSSSSPIYDNLPVDSETIRILTLLPSPDQTSEIHCSLGAAKFLRLTLHGAITGISSHFEALSYTWGAKEPRYRLVCDGSEIEIGQNLFEALKALRYPKVERKLWIDAICINQEDEEEKAAQVPFMKYIYHYAARVVIWLGPEDAGTKSAFALIRLASKCGQQELGVSVIPFIGRSANWLFYWLLGALYYYFAWVQPTIAHEEFNAGASSARGFPSMKVQKDIDEWVALVRILKRGWFSRCWIKQESAVASIATIQVGTHLLAWTDLCVAIRFFAHKRYAQGLNPQKLKEYRPKLQGLETFNGFAEVVRNVYALCGYSRIGFGRRTWRPIPLIDLLESTRHMQASRKVDKVYAMLGLAEEEAMFKVDYTTSVKDLYTNVSRVLLETPTGLEGSRYPLQALAHVKHYPILSSTERRTEPAEGDEKQETKPEEPLPSWVACWHDPLQATDIRKENESLRMFIISGLKAAKKFCAGGTGYYAPRVDPKIPYEISFEGFEFGTISTAKEILQILHTLPLSRSRLWDLVTDIWSVIPDRHVAYPTNESMDEAFAQTLTMADTVSLMASKGEETYHAIDFQHFCVSIYDQTVEALQKDGRTVDIDDLRAKWEGEHERLKTEVGERDKSPTFSRDLQRTCRGRQLFGTADGYIGVGDITLVPGDLVCVLLGGKTPFILRPNVGGKYRFVGECYLHGIMLGEACEKGLARKKWFTLI